MPVRYVWRDGHFRDRNGDPMPIPEREGLCVPRVMPDIEEYRSPIDGSVIGSRSTRRYDLEKNGCYEAEPRRRGYKNPRFAKKRGLPLNEEARETAGNTEWL
jgi:hypothetical protein